jgi:hypothetical protein
MSWTSFGQLVSYTLLATGCLGLLISIARGSRR